MALVKFSTLLQDQSPSGTFVVDTSFVLAAATGGSKNSEKRYKTAFDLKRHLIKHSVGLVYTGLIQNEATHKTREVLFFQAIEKELKRYPKVVKTFKDSRNDMKEVLKAGYVKAFEAAFGKKGASIKAELDSIFFGCRYLSTNEMKPKPSWDRVREIIATYGLDSTDAMLINFAISQKTFNGFITMDSDFRFCNDVDGFDIIIPDNIYAFDGPKDLE